MPMAGKVMRSPCSSTSSTFEHNGSKYILDGHHRVAAARAAGIEVPYNSIPASRLPEFNYKSVDDVIWSAVEAGGR
jgi:uncharacterized protein (DUF1015 family)